MRRHRTRYVSSQEDFELKFFCTSQPILSTASDPDMLREAVCTEVCKEFNLIEIEHAQEISIRTRDRCRIDVPIR